MTRQQAGVSAVPYGKPTLTFGDGEYSCASCGLGMREPCQHWRGFLEAAATAPPEQAARHGYDCVKVRHETKRSGYLHDDLDDGPYDVDGVLYCGRCHIALSRSGISGKQLQAMLLTWFDRYHKFTDISVDMLPHQAAEKVFKELRQFVAESLI